MLFTVYCFYIFYVTFFAVKTCTSIINMANFTLTMFLCLRLTCLCREYFGENHPLYVKALIHLVAYCNEFRQDEQSIIIAKVILLKHVALTFSTAVGNYESHILSVRLNYLTCSRIMLVHASHTACDVTESGGDFGEDFRRRVESAVCASARDAGKGVAGESAHQRRPVRDTRTARLPHRARPASVTASQVCQLQDDQWSVLFYNCTIGS